VLRFVSQNKNTIKFLGNLVYILIWLPGTDLSLEFVYLAGLLGIFGGFRMVVNSINVYLSDKFEQKQKV
jgi:hypothetical protein